MNHIVYSVNVLYSVVYFPLSTSCFARSWLLKLIYDQFFVLVLKFYLISHRMCEKVISEVVFYFVCFTRSRVDCTLNSLVSLASSSLAYTVHRVFI